MSKASLTPKEKFIVGDYILKHCKIPENEQYAKWDQESGGSDITVADKLRPQIPRITVYHVRYLRQNFDLPLEPPRVIFQAPRKDYKSTDLDLLRDKLEAMAAHVKECDVRLKDYGARIADLETRLEAMEDKYTNPKVTEPEPDKATYDLSSIAINNQKKERDGWIDDAAGKAVAATLDPHTEKVHPVRLYRKGKHHHNRN